MESTEPHLTPYTTLAMVLVALLLLTGLTIGVSYINLGEYNVVIALAIASCKVSLVLLFFMHLKHEEKAIIISFLTTIVVLAILIGFTFWDVAFRH